MGSSYSALDDDNPKYAKPTLVRWHNKPPPEAVTVYLVSSKHNYWSLAIDFESKLPIDAPLDLRTFSGVMCIPQLVEKRQIFSQTVEWPCAKTLASFPIDTSTSIRLGTCSILQTEKRSKMSDYMTCDILASAFTLHFHRCFYDLCEQVHSSSNVAPARTQVFVSNDTLHHVEWPAEESRIGDYWDDELNDKSVILALIKSLGLNDCIQIPYKPEVDLAMATLISKAQILLPTVDGPIIPVK
jgi:hypothetical protein